MSVGPVVIHVEEVKICFPLLTGEAVVSILVQHNEGGTRRHAKLLSRYKPVAVLIENVEAGIVLLPGDVVISISI